MLDFRGLVKLLEERGELYRISRPVEARFEMPAVMEQVERQRRGFLFTQVKGARFPLVGGVLNRLECYGWALGSTPGEPYTAADLDARFEQAKAAGIPPRTTTGGPVKDVIRTGADVNLADLPVPTVFELDSGPFITAAVGIARNPRTGTLNVGVYRTLILGRNIFAINASSLSDLRTFYQHAEQAGEPMSIALAIGVEPALQMAASCKLPPHLSELDLAGGLQGRPIELVKAETSDLLVPANAEFIIEGRVDFSRKIENTLGEFAGQYGPETAPVTEVTAITHRKDAMFYSILAGKNPEHNTLGSIATFAIQRALAAALRKQVPSIRDINVYLDPRFGSMAHIVIAITKTSDAEPMAVIEAAFAAAGGFFPVSHITKRIVVVDDDVNVHDLDDVEWAIWSRVADARKYRVIPDVESWELERCAKEGRGSLRLGIDATMDMEDRDKLRRPVIPGADRISLADYLDRKSAA
ncbi:MAG: UbiD family decarboxylase [Gammaproteobacteria bacterium]|nr:UbiD family decarboxylase [Gammaproteobacteria bacterium]